MKVEIFLNIERTIKLELFEEVAPKTVANFIKLVKDGIYKKTCFHRVIKGFMIQGGGYIIENNTIKDTKEVKAIEGEFLENGFKNDLKHEVGVISMARTSDPNSASSQFFICAAECSFLDGKYAAFGKTIDEESIETIHIVENIPTMNLGGAFCDIPQYDIHIVDIKII